MENTVLYLLMLALLGLLFYGVLRSLNSIWLKPKFFFDIMKPKLLQKHLKQQGIMGTTYRPLIGDMKEFVKLITEAWSKPINLDHKIVSRVDPFTSNNVQKYGKISMFWSGTSPRLIIKDLKLMMEVLSNKQGHFGKPPLNPNILIITRGLSTLEGDNWARRSRILNPSFPLEKLKDMLPVFSTSCSSMIERWLNMTSLEGKCDIDVWPEFQKLTADVISRAAFGSNYEEGERIFKLLKELVVLVIEAMQTLYLPGFRFIPTKKNQRRKELDREVRSMLRDLIQRKKNSMTQGQSRNDDLLGQLLESFTENNGQNGGQVTGRCSRGVQAVLRGRPRDNLELADMDNGSTSHTPRLARKGKEGGPANWSGARIGLQNLNQLQNNKHDTS
ncbi:hypothetical protein K1719_005666 [Acacia pycnantha]|nr:hypothetical protein K1719_005666 [Acacia pycnantha]